MKLRNILMLFVMLSGSVHAAGGGIWGETEENDQQDGEQVAAAISMQPATAAPVEAFVVVDVNKKYPWDKEVPVPTASPLYNYVEKIFDKMKRYVERKTKSGMINANFSEELRNAENEWEKRVALLANGQHIVSAEQLENVYKKLVLDEGDDVEDDSQDNQSQDQDQDYDYYY